MPVFAYKAVGTGDSGLSGSIVADTARQARDALRGRGLTITDVRPQSRRSAFGWRPVRKDRAAVPSFIRNLATLLTAGIPLLAALDTLAEQYRGHFRSIVQSLSDQVAAGVGLAEAMRREGDYFDELAVSIVDVGENTGALEKALARLAQFQDRAGRLRGRVASAMIYPAVVTVVGIAVSVFLMTYVVPNLMETLQQAGKELPVLTRFIKGASDLLVGYWWAILAAVAAAAAAFTAVLKTRAGRLAADRLVLRIPVVGDLLKKEYTSRIAVVLEALLSSGLGFIEAIEITRRTVRNSVFATALEEYRTAVEAGRDVAEPLRASGVFSPTVVQMLAVGQESGQLEEMLRQLAETYDQEVAVATQRLTSLLEPLVILLLALLVGSVALATILPILEAGNVL
ncbi:MAG: type II secretion system F family protein [Planctomycetota bacterium]|nr:type II secretion system F family protein [Planctomycetota bacterium]